MDSETKASPLAENDQKRSRLGRRGLVASAAALVVGLAAKDAIESEKVAATDGSPLVVGQTNTTGNLNNGGFTTVLQYTPTAVPPPAAGVPAFRVINNLYGAGQLDANIDAIQGFAVGTGNEGVLGRNDDLNGVGIYGVATNGAGIAGQSSGGTAVSGSATSGAGGFFTSTSGFGVFGQSSSTYGVYGASSSNAGLYGSTVTGYGVLAAASAGAIAALYGSSTNANTPAFAASNYAAGGLAGSFNGNVFVNGAQVVGGGKSAAVPHPDGTHRLLYCMESPESWFEDFGEGTLVGGKVEVKLDPDFAAVVDTSQLHVFLTPHDASHHLAVTSRSGAKFNVEAGVSGDAAAKGVKASDVNGTFTYRIVAKRKDIALPRLAKFQIPDIVNHVPPKVEPPKKNAQPNRHADGPVKS